MKSRSALLLLTLVCLACRAGERPTGSEGPPDEVVVMGMIHSGHETSATYGIAQVQEMVRRIDPDYILCEIPPDRLDETLRQLRAGEEISEPRVSRFPEYVDAILPLMDELDFELVPCAAWTSAMAEDRRAKLAQWETTRPEDSAAVDAGTRWIDEQLAREGLAEDDPLAIHSDRYDEIVAQGLEPYDRLFNDDLGLGGWNNINAAHFAYIRRALDERRGRGSRFLITFGAWHKHWFLDALEGVPGIQIKKPQDYDQGPPGMSR